VRCLGDALLQLAHMRPLYTPRRIGGCVYYGITTTTTPYLPSLILFLHMQKKKKKNSFCADKPNYQQNTDNKPMLKSSR